MKHGLRAQEHRLVPALFASFGLPVGLFIFAWCSRASIHWIASVIGITLFAASKFLHRKVFTTIDSRKPW